MLKNYAYYNVQTGLIENNIHIEDDVAPTLSWPDGYAIVEMPEGLSGQWSTCGIGWSYVNGEFVEPAMPESIDSTPVNQPISQGSQTL
jgi:hypothetical protein